jgi:hypothetical protein
MCDPRAPQFTPSIPSDCCSVRGAQQDRRHLPRHQATAPVCGRPGPDLTKKRKLFPGGMSGVLKFGVDRASTRSYEAAKVFGRRRLRVCRSLVGCLCLQCTVRLEARQCGRTVLGGHNSRIDSGGDPRSGSGMQTELLDGRFSKDSNA